MIQEFSIENTYSIKTRQTISFEAADDADDIHCVDVGGKKLLKLAAIYGANASGKSNVIKGFDFYTNFILNSFSSLKPHAPIPFTPFLFDGTYRDKPGYFEIIFYFENMRYVYTIEVDNHFVHNESLACEHDNIKEMLFYRYFKKFHDSKIEYEWFQGKNLSGDIEAIVPMTRVNASFLNTAAQLNHPQLMKIYQYFADMVLPVIKPSTRGFLRTVDLLEKNVKAKYEIIQLLDRADVSLKDIIIEHEDIEKITLADRSFRTSGLSTSIYFSHHYDDDVQLPFSDESDGTRRLFVLAGPLMRLIHEYTFLAIDEIEMSLHEELLEYFLKTFLKNSSGSQIMFTTHNQDLLDSDVLRNDEIWFVEKDKTGGSGLFSLIEFKDVPEDVSRRKLYKAGGFGAVPLILHGGRA